MPLFIVILRIALSAVFGTAGVTKLVDQPGTREAIKNFGVPAWLAPSLSIALPIAEIAIAIGLLFVNTTRASALASLLLLALFVVAIGVNLARGRTHDCHCFGQLHSRPLGWPTLLRNLVFALAAGIVLWQAETDSVTGIGSTLAPLTYSQWLWLIGVLVVAVALIFYSRYRQRQSPVAAASPRGLPLGAAAPPFELAAYVGGTISLTELLAHGKPLLLVFTNPNCGPCVVLFQEIKEWQEAHSERLTIALISVGTIKENFVNVARNGLGQVLLQQEREVAEQYGAHVTPTAVVINTDGKIAGELAAGADEIRALLAGVLGNPSSAKQNEAPIA